MARYFEHNASRIRVAYVFTLCRKYFLMHLLIGAAVVYLLFTFGQGLVPRIPLLLTDTDIKTLVFFEVNNDASKITWSRAANTKGKVEKAITSNVHMIEGDIILQGEGTSEQKLVPVMMDQMSQSDDSFLFVDWLDSVHYRMKGIKLDFKSIEPVEITLQKLFEFNLRTPLRVPVWIHANVLRGPHGGKVKVDPSRFFRTLKREFPKCTLSLGWTTGTHTDLSQSGYSWDMVLDMYHLVKKWRNEDQPIIFEVRLSLVRNSVTQLKWLCDNVQQSSLNVIHVEKDAVLAEDLMYIAYRFPPESVYFDLNHHRYENMLQMYRHFSKEKVSRYVTRRDEVMFHHKDWLKMGFYIQEDSIMPSTESLIFTAPIVYIVTKASYAPGSGAAVQGRVKFLNRENAKAEPFSTGLNIYVRLSSYPNFDSIVGIKCFVGVDGDVEIKGSNLPSTVSDFRRTGRLTPSAVTCFRFSVMDTGDEVVMQVSTEHDCHTLESVIPLEDNHLTLTASIPRQLDRDSAKPFLVRMEDNRRQAVIDELTVKYK